jgi:hypothetical protein
VKAWRAVLHAGLVIAAASLIVLSGGGTWAHSGEGEAARRDRRVLALTPAGAATVGILMGIYAGYGGLTVALVKKYRGRVLPGKFRKVPHAVTGLVFYVLMIAALALGYVLAGAIGGEETALLETHGVLGIAIVVLYVLAGLLGWKLYRGKGTPLDPTLHMWLNYGACTLVGVQVVLGLVLLSQVW